MLQLEMSSDVAIITLTSPPVNALDTLLLDKLHQTLITLENSAARAVILTAEGRCFSAGLDLKAIRRMDMAGRLELVAALNRCLERLYGFARPVVAAVNGHAIAGGMVLTLAADHRLCVEAPIKLGLAEVRVGIPFPMGARAIVQNELTPAGFRMFALLGHNMDPQGSRRYGVIDEIVAADQLLSRANEVAHEVAELPDAAFLAIKQYARAAALQRIRSVIASGQDPVFDAWDQQYPL